MNATASKNRRWISHPWTVAAVALLLAALLLPAPQAHAHGGQFRGPGAPPPTGPGMAPVGLPSVVTPGDTWQTWWDLNRLGLIPGRDEALRRQVITPGDDAPGSERTESLEEGWAKRRAMVARTSVVPFLLRLVDPRRDVRDEVVAAALIALGKVGQEGIVPKMLLGWLRDRSAADIVRESAALGLGLLRRTQPALQLDGAFLDGLREALLEVVDDRDTPVRVRAFAALAVGLLGDQPFGSPYTKDGLLVSRALWKRLERAPSGVDVPIAVMVALGMQPPAGVSAEARKGLHHIVLGKAINNRRFKDLERSHALTALYRLGGPGSQALLLRMLGGVREDVNLRRATYLAVGLLAPSLSSAERVEVATGIERALKSRRDPLTTGLGYIAAGRILRQDLKDGKIEVLDAADLTRILLAAAKKGPATERGYAAIALALAAQGAEESGLARPLLERVRSLLLGGLESSRGDDTLRASYAAAVGLLDVRAAIDPLLTIVRDVNGNLVLRGHAAVALGQMGHRADEVRPALVAMLREKRGTQLRIRGAMALALLGGRLARTELLQELTTASSQYHQAHVVIALARLGDLRAVPDLLDYAADPKRPELAQALGVVALGILADPEARPSILKLTQDSNYPAATSVLLSAYSIF